MSAGDAAGPARYLTSGVESNLRTAAVSKVLVIARR